MGKKFLSVQNSIDHIKMTKLPIVYSLTLLPCIWFHLSFVRLILFLLFLVLEGRNTIYRNTNHKKGKKTHSNLIQFPILNSFFFPFPSLSHPFPFTMIHSIPPFFLFCYFPLLFPYLPLPFPFPYLPFPYPFFSFSLPFLIFSFPSPSPPFENPAQML